MAVKILALMGRDGSGKSTTLRRLIQSLVDDPRGSFTCKKDKDRFERTKGDVSLPLVYGGRLLAITTMGDGPSALKPFFEQYGAFAELLICASHEKETATYRYLEGFREQNHTVEYLYKRVVEAEAQHDAVNAQDVECLQCKMEKMLEQEEC